MWCSTQCEQAWYKTLFNGPGALTTARCWHPAGCLALTGWPLTSCWLTFYVNDVREGIGLPSVWEDLSGQVYLGDEKFVTKMSAMAEQTPQGARTGRSRLEIPHAQRRPVPLPLQGYIEQHPNTRNAGIQAAFATVIYTMAQLAEHFGLHYTSVSRIVKLG